MPFQESRDSTDAARVATRWADEEAVRRGRASILVVDHKSDVHDGTPLASCLNGRCASVRSQQVDAPVGAVIAYLPSPKAFALATRHAKGCSLVVVEHPSPWRLKGWAGALDALDLDSGQSTSFDTGIRNVVARLATDGHNGYGPNRDRESARRTLVTAASAGLLDRDLILGAPGAYGISAAGQFEMERLVSRVVN